MPTYILDDHDRTSIARRPLSLTVTNDGRAGPVLLAARRNEQPERGARFPRPQLMILPEAVLPVRATPGAAAERTVVRVVPGDGSVFSQGTRLTVTVRTEQPRHLEADVVVVRGVDVSGLAHRDMLVIEGRPDGDRLDVSALNAIVDPQLRPLGAAARAAARSQLGIDRTSRAADLVVAVDTSVSMNSALRDRSVAAVVDVVTGLSQVIGWGCDLSVRLLADPPHRIPDVPATELADTVEGQLADLGLGCGSRTAVTSQAGGRERITYVVTDGEPADVVALRRAHRPDDLRHLIVLGDAGARPASPAASGLPRSVLDSPPPGTDAVAHLLGSPRLLTDLVASLLVGVSAAQDLVEQR